MEALFFILLGIVIYTYVGYALVILLFVKIKRAFSKRTISTPTCDQPEITVVIAAYNEEMLIGQKIENTLSLDYPKDKLKVIVVSDGSTDKTAEIAKSYTNVLVLMDENRTGKTAAINKAMLNVQSPITVFTDANAFLNKDALLKMAYHFTNPKVGVVAGEKRVYSNSKNTAATEGLYWKYESFLKKYDFYLNSTVGAAGELYAIRTELFEPLSSSVILDDFVLSMKIAAKGFVIAYEPNAFASETCSVSVKEEKKRKSRISAGGLQSIAILKEFWHPFNFPLLWFQYFSHRVLRWTMAPMAMAILIPLNLYLVLNNPTPFYVIIGLFQLFFYFSAIVGAQFESSKKGHFKLFKVAYYFLMMNLSVFKGAYNLFKGNQTVIWEKVLRAN